MEGQSYSCYGQLIKNAKMFLHNYRSWSVKHVKRDINMAIHRLTKGAIQQSLEKIWVEEFLDFILDIVSAFQVSAIWLMKSLDFHSKNKK